MCIVPSHHTKSHSVYTQAFRPRHPDSQCAGRNPGAIDSWGDGKAIIRFLEPFDLYFWSMFSLPNIINSVCISFYCLSNVSRVLLLLTAL